MSASHWAQLLLPSAVSLPALVSPRVSAAGDSRMWLGLHVTPALTRVCSTTRWVNLPFLGLRCQLG